MYNYRMPFLHLFLGLDPAQPGFDLSDPDDTLGPEDAQFVGENTSTYYISEIQYH